MPINLGNSRPAPRAIGLALPMLSVLLTRPDHLCLDLLTGKANLYLFLFLNLKTLVCYHDLGHQGSRALDEIPYKSGVFVFHMNFLQHLSLIMLAQQFCVFQTKKKCVRAAFFVVLKMFFLKKPAIFTLANSKGHLFDKQKCLHWLRSRQSALRNQCKSFEAKQKGFRIRKFITKRSRMLSIIKCSRSYHRILIIWQSQSYWSAFCLF